MIGSNYKDMKIPLRGTLGPSKSSQGGADLESESSSPPGEDVIAEPWMVEKAFELPGPEWLHSYWAKGKHPWPPEELWLTGGHTGGRGRLPPGRAARELGFTGVRGGRASVDSPLGCGQAETSGCSY